MTIVDVIKQLCQKKDISISRLEEEMGFGKNSLYRWKERQPSIDKVQKVADYFDVSIDFLLGRNNKTDNITKDAEGFTEKDRKDIGKRMEEIRKDLTNADGLMFSGEPLSEEALDSLMDAMEYIVKHTQKVNKKYIPKKYRDKSE
ncbi:MULTISPECIES: helix-turn-helix domain-containing protein [Bacillus]|uniref:helix-turn-helix domain-containing protein n=1 Tax=Bacillus TaxID=1386 RepID=UPI000364D2C0|nr:MULTISPECIES: helix-turn-helix transcriptional regulator [Bacillus]MED1539125.1 helix-turn-helix transcriptional regulator [Bacillus pseudomycoides]PGC41456.1 XRE family transcriptional regulator [Bacillus pseudomycoides]